MLLVSIFVDYFFQKFFCIFLIYALTGGVEVNVHYHIIYRFKNLTSQLQVASI
jgi:hypothetical protein